MPHQPHDRSFVVAARRAVFATLAVAAALGLSVGQAAARPSDTSSVSCGDLITRDTTLQNDLVDCPDDGLVIGADNITVDLNGHVVDGLGDEICLASRVGIFNHGHTGVTIEGGVVREFTLGVLLVHATSNTLSDLTVSDACTGITVNSGFGNVVDQNVVHNHTYGIQLLFSDHNRVTRNTQSNDDTPDRRQNDARNGISLFDSDDNLIRQNSVTVNSFGISIDASLPNDASSHNVVEKNSATGNEFAGIEVSSSDATIVRKNQVSDNVDVPGGIDGFGDGILVWDRSTDTRVEHNVTSGNSGDGIDVGGFLGNSVPGTLLTKNTANGNGDLGINALPGVIDGGGNKARGNGNPLNCLNVACK